MLAGIPSPTFAQQPGDRPTQSSKIQVINPRDRVPVGLIIDDSTCLVNLNRFAMPQFNAAWGGKNKAYHRNWKRWPVEIPDSFVRKFVHFYNKNDHFSKIYKNMVCFIIMFSTLSTRGSDPSNYRNIFSCFRRINHIITITKILIFVINFALFKS